MAMADDLNRLTTILVRDMVLTKRAQQLRLANSVALGDLAKASGATPELVGLWETGRATPTTAQALAWLTLLHERASWREAAGHAGAAS